MRVTTAALDRLSAAIFVLFIIAVAAIAMLVPEREWDMTAISR
ncbi:hypothetical protein [Bradyrhizobium icense]|nr:hypothetical protein [Bradyrhizobium icense]